MDRFVFDINGIKYDQIGNNSVNQKNVTKPQLLMFMATRHLVANLAIQGYKFGAQLGDELPIYENMFISALNARQINYYGLYFNNISQIIDRVQWDGKYKVKLISGGVFPICEISLSIFPTMTPTISELDMGVWDIIELAYSM